MAKENAGWEPLGSDAARIDDPASAEEATRAMRQGADVIVHVRPQKPITNPAPLGDPATVSRPRRRGRPV